MTKYIHIITEEKAELDTHPIVKNTKIILTKP